MAVQRARAVGQIGGIVLLLDIAQVAQHRGDVAGPALFFPKRSRARTRK